MIILLFLATFKVLFLVFPSIVLAAAREGLVLWLNNVLPALLPFMIITNMLVVLGFAESIGKILAPVMKKVFGLPGAGGFALIVGLTSGYPIGAKAVADLRKSNNLSLQEAQHLLAFSNNAGPLFVLGVVGIGFFNSATVGYILWAGHIIAAIILGILLKFFYGSDSSSNLNSQTNKTKSKRLLSVTVWISSRLNPANLSAIKPGKALSDSVKNAMESILVIGGIIIFFSAIMAVLEEIGFPDTGLLAGLLAGVVEITSGVRDISNVGITATSLGVAAFVIGFSGLSIHMQTLHFTDGTGIKAIPYIFSKFVHGVIAAAITVIIWRIFME